MWRTLTVLAVGGLLTSCSTGPAGPAAPTGPPPPGPVSAFQREILANGVVTFAEYERAVLAAMACIEEASPNIEVVGPWLQDTQLAYGFGVSGSSDEMEALERLAEEAGDRCELEYLAFVADAWFNQSMPSERERAELLASLVACLRDGGAVVSDTPGHDELESLLFEQPDDAVRVCFTSHARYFMIPVEIPDVSQR